VSSGALAGAPVWALAAVSLPYLVGRRSLALDAVRVVGWTAFVVSATEVAVRAGHGSGISAPRTAVVGAAAAAVVALSPSAAAAWRRRRRSNEPQAGIP
jgi:hypothetical protein